MIMNIKNKLIGCLQKIKDYKTITISGEINISNKDIKKSILSEDEVCDQLQLYFNEFSCIRRYFKVDTVKNAYEIAYKFFVNKNINFETDYLKNLQHDLSELLNKLYSSDRFTIRLNVIGAYRTPKTLNKFIMMNNNEEIRYKITEMKNIKYLCIIEE